MWQKCRYILCVLALLMVVPTSSWAQSNKWRDIHKVKKKETIFGIARDYGLTVDQLKEANPVMMKPDYQLKKGDYVFIPFPPAPVQAEEAPVVVTDDVRTRAIRIGVMLPLHSINGDGHRMTEYYRGILMACDSLKHSGISTEIWAWNVPEDGDIANAIADPAAAKCDLIIGPLYSKYVPKLSQFCEEHNILMFIPFSIHAPELFSNRNIFQVYQTQNQQNETVVSMFQQRFKNYHPVFIDCADATSTKGSFTTLLRRSLDADNIAYNLTSLASTDDNFQRAFSRKQPNVVILNTARSSELTQAFGKLSTVAATYPEVRISMMGYTDWMMYTRRNLENYYKYDVYIPAPFFTNVISDQMEAFSKAYRANFRQDMMQTLPRFAVTGFDHAMFFLKGMHQYGKEFKGADASVSYQPIQTPLAFERIDGGGLQNQVMFFVRYTPEKTIEKIEYR